MKFLLERLFCMFFIFGTSLCPLASRAEAFTAHVEIDPDHKRYLAFPTDPGYHYTVERSSDLVTFGPASETGAAYYGDGSPKRFLFLDDPPPPPPGTPPPAPKPSIALNLTVHCYSEYGSPHVRLECTVPDPWSKVIPQTFPRLPSFNFYYVEGESHRYIITLQSVVHPANELDNVPETIPFPETAQEELNVFNALIPTILGQISTPPGWSYTPPPASEPERWFYRVIKRQIDTNGNGLWDSFELENYFDPFALENIGNWMNPEDDFDNDGVLNIHEQALGTSPWSGDSDQDGAPDGDDPQPANSAVHGVRQIANSRTGDFGGGTLPSIRVGANWNGATNTEYTLPEDTPQLSAADVASRAALENPFPATPALSSTNNLSANSAHAVLAFSQVTPPSAGNHAFNHVFLSHCSVSLLRDSGLPTTLALETRSFLRVQLSKSNPLVDWGTAENFELLLNTADDLSASQVDLVIDHLQTESNRLELVPVCQAGDNQLAVDMLVPLQIQVVDRDDPEKGWSDANAGAQGHPIYAGTESGDMVAWSLYGPSSATYSWSAVGPDGETITGPSGSGKREWTISDDDDDPAVDWLTWKPGTYAMKCVVELLDGASVDFEFEQIVGWRTECWLVIGQIVQTHTHDSANPDSTGGKPSFRFALLKDIMPEGPIWDGFRWDIATSDLPITGKLSEAWIGYWGFIKDHQSTPKGPYAPYDAISHSQRLWMVQHLFNISYDTAPLPDTIDTEKLKLVQSEKSYRIFHKYQCKFEVEEGKIRANSLRHIDPIGDPGTTKVSIGLDQGELLPYWDNPSFTYPLFQDQPEENPESTVEGRVGMGGKATSSYFSLRVGAKGRNANWRLFGKDAPWIFSEIIAELVPDGSVVTRLRTSVDIHWQDGQVIDGTVTFNNINIYERKPPEINGTSSVWDYVRRSTLTMEGQLEPFIMSASGNWPEPSLPPEIK